MTTLHRVASALASFTPTLSCSLGYFFERVVAHRQCVQACSERHYMLSKQNKIDAVRTALDSWCDVAARQSGIIPVHIFGQFFKDWCDAANVWDQMVPWARTREAARTAYLRITARPFPTSDSSDDSSDDSCWSSSSSPLYDTSDDDDDDDSSFPWSEGSSE